ncbi:hypothetical protein VTG60DRAFT_3954 [Thermothelomyces hinnuleus]
MRFPLSVWRCGPASLFGPVLAPLTPPYLVVCKTASAALQPRRVPGKESKDDRDNGSSGPSWLVPRPLLGTDPLSGPVRLLNPRLQGATHLPCMWLARAANPIASTECPKEEAHIAVLHAANILSRVSTWPRMITPAMDNDPFPPHHPSQVGLPLSRLAWSCLPPR